MYQTLEAMKEQGYVVDKLTPTSDGNEIVWDSENNQFVLVYENGETFTGTTVEPTTDKSKMWKVYTEIPTESEYSVYLAGTSVTGNVEVKGVGFDAGENTGISTVTYTNETTTAKAVVLRTNGGVLNVNAPLDTVTHYEKADKVVITAVAGNSYHENGEVTGNIEIASGRVEVAKNASVDSILVTGNDVKVEFKDKENVSKLMVSDTVDADKQPDVVGADIEVSSVKIVKTYDELKSTIFNYGGNIVLGADIKTSSTIQMREDLLKGSHDVVLNLNGHIYTYRPTTSVSSNATFSVKNTINFTIEGNGAIYVPEDRSARLFDVYTGGKLTINSGSYLAPNNDSSTPLLRGGYDTTKGGDIIINGGTFLAKDACFGLFQGTNLVIKDGEFTSNDNFIIGTNGNSGYGDNTITITGGTFNANIESEGYIACGIYLANTDTLNVTGGTFNITNGVGIVIRGGKATIKNVEINLNNSGEIVNGKVGDSKARINVSAKIVIDRFSEYPAYEIIDVTAEGFTLVDANGNAVDKNGNLIAE